MSEQPHQEPSLRAEPTRAEERLIDLFERAESVLTSVVALFLIGFVVVALVAVIWEVKGPLLDQQDFTSAALRGVEASFLAIILLELLHTTLSRGPIGQQLQEFLVIGITATIRHGLQIAATRGDPRDVVINVAINAAGALVLVAALWLVRQQLRAAPAPARDGHLHSSAATDPDRERRGGI
jgi:phosphate starvation-inducible membrane PsiE